MDVACPNRSTRYAVKASAAGKRFRCKRCGQTCEVPLETPVEDSLFIEEEQAPAAVRPARRPRPSRREDATGKRIVLFAVAGSAVFLLLVGVAVVWTVGAAINRSNQAAPANSSPFEALAEFERLTYVSPEARQPYPLATAQLPPFPELSDPRQTETVALVYEIELGAMNMNWAAAGFPTQVRLWLPSGQHANSSLGCILVAPAGTNLLTGHALEEPSDDSEMAP
jgi:hypothetical protein